MPGRTPLHLPALSATVLRPAFLPPNQECSTDSSGLPDLLPPSDDLDWGQLCFPCDFLLRSSTPPAHPVFPSTSPGLPRVLLSHLAAPDLALSSASRLVHSAAKTCYASSRSISFSCDCTLSALITASLTPSAIGDRPSHAICLSQLSRDASLLTTPYLKSEVIFKVAIRRASKPNCEVSGGGANRVPVASNYLECVRFARS